MKTKMTAVYLDTDLEVKALHDEISLITAELKYKSILDFITKYPLLNKLRQTLRDELEEETARY